MTKAITGLMAAALVAGAFAGPATAAKMAKGKMVTMYQADKCHMYFTAAQYKMYHGACPASKGKMHKVMVTPAAAAAGEAATTKALPAEKAAKPAM